MTELSSWNDTGTTQSIVEFVETRAREIPPEERVAVFDNDGTLWSEKPMPIELGFILQRLAAMAEEDASLREKQPWKAAREKDYAWLSGVIDKHYAGDDSDVKVLMGGILRAFADQTVEEYLKRMADEAGGTVDEAAEELSKAMPEVVDKLTPEGELPSDDAVRSEFSRS
jgi:YidB-like protein